MQMTATTTKKTTTVDRVRDFIRADLAGAESYAVAEVSAALKISDDAAGRALLALYKDGLADRTKIGQLFMYSLVKGPVVVDLREPADEQREPAQAFVAEVDTTGAASLLARDNARSAKVLADALAGRDHSLTAARAQLADAIAAREANTSPAFEAGLVNAVADAHKWIAVLEEGRRLEQEARALGEGPLSAEEDAVSDDVEALAAELGLPESEVDTDAVLARAVMVDPEMDATLTDEGALAARAVVDAAAEVFACIECGKSMTREECGAMKADERVCDGCSGMLTPSSAPAAAAPPPRTIKLSDGTTATIVDAPPLFSGKATTGHVFAVQAAWSVTRDPEARTLAVRGLLATFEPELVLRTCKKALAKLSEPLNPGLHALLKTISDETNAKLKELKAVAAGDPAAPRTPSGRTAGVQDEVRVRRLTSGKSYLEIAMYDVRPKGTAFEVTKTVLADGRMSITLVEKAGGAP